MLWRMSGSGTMSSFSAQRPLTLDAIRAPRQSPRACRSLAELNAAWKCLSGVRERLGDYASP